jgi:hypothetical protein
MSSTLIFATSGSIDRALAEKHRVAGVVVLQVTRRQRLFAMGHDLAKLSSRRSGQDRE